MKFSQNVSEFYKRAYILPRRPSHLSNFRVNKILSLVGSGKKVLDVGCYDGTITKEIEKQGNQVIGIDISTKAIQTARKKGIRAYVCNIEEENLSLSLGKFDVVFAGEIIEHIFDTDSLIKKLRRVLKPSGNLMITTPNLAGVGARLSLLVGKLPWMIENDILPGKSGHIRYFTFSELEKLLLRNGFKIEVVTTDSVGLGNFTIPFLDRFFSTFGRILIVKAQKI